MSEQEEERLDCAWDIENGFLGRLREGEFNRPLYEDFLSLLKSITIPDEAFIPKKVVSLLWYVYPFVQWQKEHIVDFGGISEEQYDLITVNIMNELERILGIP